MGEGSTAGAKDVSDQLENEDQLLGNDKEDQDRSNDNPEDGNAQGKLLGTRILHYGCDTIRMKKSNLYSLSTGIEMADDFEGKLEDIEQDEQDSSGAGAQGQNILKYSLLLLAHSV